MSADLIVIKPTTEAFEYYARVQAERVAELEATLQEQATHMRTLKAALVISWGVFFLFEIVWPITARIYGGIW